MKSSFIKRLFKRSQGEDQSKPDAFLNDSMLLEQVEYERAVYLDTFLKQLDSLDTQGITYKTEVDQHEFNASKKTPQPPLRVDALYEEEGEYKIVEANIANPPMFEAITEEWDDIKMILHPFVWNAVDFEVIGPFPDLAQLGNWINRWFDPKNRNRKNEQNLRSVIHKITEPKEIEDGWRITIDFGSAELEAFVAFFKQCRFNEAEIIKISSEQYYKQLEESYNLSSATTTTAITTTAHPI